MKKKTDLSLPPSEKDEKKELPGYPVYPENEDIYNKSKEEKSVDPENTSQKKELIKKRKAGKNNEKDFDEDKSGSDLDVPGSELDDQQESKGSEDEENNYYSLGGDDHSDLDEE